MSLSRSESTSVAAVTGTGSPFSASVRKVIPSSSMEIAKRAPERCASLSCGLPRPAVEGAVGADACGAQLEGRHRAPPSPPVVSITNTSRRAAGSGKTPSASQARRMRSMPEAEADAGRRWAAEVFDQAVVATAAPDGVLRRLERGRGELERGARVVVEAADEARIDLVRDAGRVETVSDAGEVRPAVVAEPVEHDAAPRSSRRCTRRACSRGRASGFSAIRSLCSSHNSIAPLCRGTPRARRGRPGGTAGRPGTLRRNVRPRRPRSA